MRLSFLSASFVMASALLACRDKETTSSSATTTGNGGAGGETVVLPAPIPLEIVNWNVRNLYNDVLDDPATMEDVDPGYNAHRAEVGTVLRAIDADVVVLAEIESQTVIDELNDLELDGAYEHRVVIDGNDPRGIDVGVLSKVPFDEVNSHVDDEFNVEGTSQPDYQFSRDALEVHMTFNGRRIVLLAVHYKAKDNDDPEKRLAEAQRARAIADGIADDDPEVALIIAGDFNDVPGSPPYEASEADGWVNAAMSVPEADRWTYDFQGTEELVDHQFVNPLMAERLTTSASILHQPEAEAASDHAPLVVTYDIN